MSHWGPMATAFLTNTEDHIVFVTEHRQSEHFRRFQGQVRKNGYKPIAHAAVATGTQGVSGGVAILGRQRKAGTIRIDGLMPSLYTSLGYTEVENSRICGAILHTDRLRILLVVVYLYHSEGLSERNQALLASVELLSRTVGLPTMIGGDFNLTREEVASSLIYRSLKLCFSVVPVGYMPGRQRIMHRSPVGSGSFSKHP